MSRQVRTVPSPTMLLLGLVAMVAFCAVAYSLLSYGPELFSAYLFVVTGVASLIGLFVIAPLLAVLIWRGRTQLGPVVASAFVVVFLIFLLGNISTLSQATTFQQQGSVLVVDGAITAAGYVTSFRDATVTALLALPGATLLWLIAFRPREKSSASQK